MGNGYDETYQQIKAAALRLFADRGYGATGIRSIAKEAGFSTAALYHHVSSKEELLMDIMRQGFEMQIGSARSVLAGERSPEAKLGALVGQHVRFEATHQTLANVITIEYGYLGDEARQKVLPLRSAYEGIWSEVIEDGVQSRAFDVADVELGALAVLEMCSSPEAWYRPDGRLTVDEISEIFTEMALLLVKARRRPHSGADKRKRPAGIS